MAAEGGGTLSVAGEQAGLEAVNKQPVSESKEGSAATDRRSASSRLQSSEQRLADLEEISDAATAEQSVELVALREAVRQDRQLVAKASLELFKRGQLAEVEPNDFAIIVQDLAKSGHESALAELILSKHGFESFQGMLRTLKLSEVEYGGQKIELPQEGVIERFSNSPVVKEELKKLGVSGGVSVALASILTLVGGPISWGIVATGLAGKTVGRLTGEVIRGRMLKRRERSTGLPESKRFNQIVAEDLLQVITNLQGQAETLLGDLADQEPEERAQATLELVRLAAGTTGRTSERYRQLAKNADRIKGGLSILGAIGGSAGASVLLGQEAAKKIAEETGDSAFEALLTEAKVNGVRIFHDTLGHAHVTADSSLGHVVKETTDGVWRFALENKDLQVALVEAKKAGLQSYEDIFHYFVGHGPGGEVLGASVPNSLPAGEELLHASQVTDAGAAVDSAIRTKLQLIAEQINRDTLVTQLVSGAIVTSPTVGTELFNAWRSGESREQQRLENRQLIHSLEEVEAFLHNRLLVGAGELTPVGRIPNESAQMPTFLERLAAYYKIPYLPKSPNGFTYDWATQPQALEKTFQLNQLPLWRRVETRGGMQGSLTDREGRIIKVGVAGVDTQRNQIAIVESIDNLGRSKATVFPVRLMRLTDFLSQYQPIVRDIEGRSIPLTTTGQPTETRTDSQGGSGNSEEASPESPPDGAITTNEQPKPPAPPTVKIEGKDVEKDFLAGFEGKKKNHREQSDARLKKGKEKLKKATSGEWLSDENFIRREIERDQTSPKITDRLLYQEDKLIFHNLFGEFADKWQSLGPDERESLGLRFSGREDRGDTWSDFIEVDNVEGVQVFIRFNQNEDGQIMASIARRTPNKQTEYNNRLTVGNLVDILRAVKQRLDGVEVSEEPPTPGKDNAKTRNRKSTAETRPIDDDAPRPEQRTKSSREKEALEQDDVQVIPVTEPPPEPLPKTVSEHDANRPTGLVQSLGQAKGADRIEALIRQQLAKNEESS